MLFKKRLLVYIFLNKVFLSLFSTLMSLNNTNSFSNSINSIIYRRDLSRNLFSFFLNEYFSRFESFNFLNCDKNVFYIKFD